MGLVYNATTGKVEYLVELDGGSGYEPIIINLTYMQDTTPSNPQEKDVWYNTSNDKLYTYKNGQWVESDPSVGVWYKFGNQYYLWDGNSLEVTDLNIYEKIENKVTSISSSSTDLQYPSAKLLFDSLALKNDIYEKIKVLTESSGNYAITLEESYRCYKIVPTADFTVSFDISQLNIPANTMFSFYLLIDESAASDSWQVTQWGTGSNVQWGNTSPTMTAMVKYLFSFTTFDGGQTWVANQMYSWQ